MLYLLLQIIYISFQSTGKEKETLITNDIPRSFSLRITSASVS